MGGDDARVVQAGCLVGEAGLVLCLVGCLPQTQQHTWRANGWDKVDRRVDAVGLGAARAGAWSGAASVLLVDGCGAQVRAGSLTWVLAGGGAQLLIDGDVLLELLSDVATVRARQRRAAAAVAAYGALHRRVHGGDACQLAQGHLVVRVEGVGLVWGGHGA